MTSLFTILQKRLDIIKGRFHGFCKENVKFPKQKQKKNLLGCSMQKVILLGDFFLTARIRFTFPGKRILKEWVKTRALKTLKPNMLSVGEGALVLFS